jgi:hypothetical protein
MADSLRHTHALLEPVYMFTRKDEVVHTWRGNCLALRSMPEEVDRSVP